MMTEKKLEDYTKEELVKKVKELQVVSLTVDRVQYKLNEMADFADQYTKENILYSMCGYIRNFITNLFKNEYEQVKKEVYKDGE